MSDYSIYIGKELDRDAFVRFSISFKQFDSHAFEIIHERDR